jgi:SAM-dependent methyltransferase
MTEQTPHWERVYSSKANNELSWFQVEPEISLRLINEAAAGDPGISLIDIGSGVSSILPRLRDAGFGDLTALDISAAAIERAHKQFGPGLTGIVADITAWKPRRTWSIWHDRAVFHFLTEDVQQIAYIKAMHEALLPGAVAIFATFAPDGPERCSGLPVQRYSAQSLSDRLGGSFQLISSELESHVTPAGKVQNFVYSTFRRLP